VVTAIGVTQIEFPLVGAGGEPVDLWRTLLSHGFTELPPMRQDAAARALEITLPVDGARPRTVRIAPGRPGFGVVHVSGRPLGPRAQAAVLASLRHILRLDEDLSAFYALTAADPDLTWACQGAGRLIRSPTVFEDVVKTICTTNCSWALTRRMVAALVEHLGEKAADAPATGWQGRLFPSAAAMAEAPLRFYRNVARAGYRAAYLRNVARSVARGDVDLEVLGRSRAHEISDGEVAERLGELPGAGPYAVSHIMLLLGRYSPLVLDSWTRPSYAQLRGRRRMSDRAIERSFRRYGSYAGLAFWLHLTRRWAE
jgi:3-methyladenine DNA glycosylase/8-oxoguanine DNA glycosylase